MNQILNGLFIILTVGTNEKQTMDSFLLVKVWSNLCCPVYFLNDHTGLKDPLTSAVETAFTTIQLAKNVSP